MNRLKKIIRSIRACFSAAISGQWQIMEDTADLRRPPRLRLRVIFYGLLTLMLVVSSVDLYRQWEEVRVAQEVVEDFDAEALFGFESEDLNSIHSIACRSPVKEGDASFQGFFSSKEGRVASDFVAKVRENILLPTLKHSLNTNGSSKKSLYVIGLLYASHHNALGNLIRSNLDVWSGQVDMPQSVIQLYVNLAVEPWAVELTPLRLALAGDEFPTRDAEDWEQFFTQLKDLQQQPVISQQVLKSIQSSAARLLEESAALHKDSLTEEVYTSLKSIPQANVSTLIDQQLDILNWVDKNRTELSAFLGLIKKTQLHAAPVGSFDLPRLVDELEAVMASSEEGGQFEITNTESVEIIPGEAWQGPVSHSRVQWLLDEFLAAQELKDPDHNLLFSKDDPTGVVSWSGDCDGCHLFLGQAEVDQRFTREAFNSKVIPLVQKLDGVLKEVSELTRSQMQAFLQRTVNDYSIAYRDSYRELYGAFATRADSVNRVKVLLVQMQNFNDSPLDDLLGIIATNTTLDTQAHPSLHVMEEQLDEFAFARRLADGGSFSRFKAYTAMLGELEDEVVNYTTPYNPDSAPGEGSDAQLRSLLSPVAQVSYGVLVGDPDSRWTQFTAWLDKEEVPEFYRRPFMEPLHRVMDVGFEEVAAVLEALWETHLLPIAMPIFEKFPFNPDATEEVSVEELTALLGPGSSFWQQVENLSGPFCSLQGRCLDTLAVKGHTLELPPQMACVLQGLFNVRAALWDEAGQPKPFTVAVKSVKPEAESDVILGYINAGSEALYSIDEVNDWQSMQVEWWKDLGATVGVTVVDKATKEKTHQRLDAPHSAWSLLRLLKKATRVEGVWTWEFPVVEGGEKPAETLPLELQDNPMQLFELQCLPAPAG